ncbi:hypothetical protein [Nocardia sp. SYP-A9097]|uniref:hypothetical protein n=1 Tax=Nocardia sp. SYP-A9097 TaxID=2663237 RepID=UPI001890DD8D|nr:hypothetical protein [Nocardia sp. SYP-A9097]
MPLLQKRSQYRRHIAPRSDVTESPAERLADIATRMRAEAVVTPSLGHFDGSTPIALIQVVDLITVEPLETFARWIIPPDATYEMRSR